MAVQTNFGFMMYCIKELYFGMYYILERVEYMSFLVDVGKYST